MHHNHCILPALVIIKCMQLILAEVQYILSNSFLLDKLKQLYGRTTYVLTNYTRHFSLALHLKTHSQVGYYPFFNKIKSI